MLPAVECLDFRCVPTYLIPKTTFHILIIPLSRISFTFELEQGWGFSFTLVNILFSFKSIPQICITAATIGTRVIP